MINKISIKMLAITSLCGIGVITIILAIISSYNFRNTSIESQENTLVRILEVSAKETLKQTEKVMGELGTDLTRLREFKTNVSAVLKTNNSENRRKLVQIMDDQFSQRFVTTGQLQLLKFRLYDTDNNFVIASSQGITQLSNGMTPSLNKKMMGREGAERLKAISDMWVSSNNSPLISMVIPVGGLRLIGYLEIIAAPQHNLFKIKDILQTPLAVFDINGKELVKTKNWDEENEHSLTIRYTINNHGNEPVLVISAKENQEFLFEQIQKTQIFTISGSVLVIFCAIGLFLFALGRFLFAPMQVMLGNMQQVAEGDLTTQTQPEGLRDIYLLSESMGKLVQSLNTQVYKIQQSADGVQQASNQVAEVTRETNNGITTQQQQTDSVATAINEMTATVQEVARNASDAADAAGEAEKQATNGQLVVTNTIDSIDSLANDVERAAQVIQQLEENSEKIGGVLDVIRNIAEQTNLLALNAAIEAARAGEQGRGFAVVADEVRTLASRTQQSTQEIQSMIENLQTGSHEAVTVMENNTVKAKETVEHASKAGGALQAINASIGTINDMNSQIASAAEEQSRVAEEINLNISRISEVAHSTTEGAKQTEAASHELFNLAEGLQNVVSKFRVG